ncbi:MAG: helix-turn-helix domain-containing protein [Candidatus Cloacimonetes bacterium]|nr:helix-turn-helix domain-containing protein [Candidatus Cloacimonadota bacterium]
MLHKFSPGLNKQVAKVIGIAVTTLRNWRSMGKGPTYQKIGGRVLYPRKGVLEFMNSFPKIKRRD